LQSPLHKLPCHRTCDARGRRAGPAFWCDGGTRARGDAIKLVARATTIGGYRALDGGRVAHKTVGWALKRPTVCHGKNVCDGNSLLATSREDKFTVDLFNLLLNILIRIVYILLRHT